MNNEKKLTICIIALSCVIVGVVAVSIARYANTDRRTLEYQRTIDGANDRIRELENTIRDGLQRQDRITKEVALATGNSNLLNAAIREYQVKCDRLEDELTTAREDISSLDIELDDYRARERILTERLAATVDNINTAIAGSYGTTERLSGVIQRLQSLTVEAQRLESFLLWFADTYGVIPNL
jgi:chromosome segregation ATPase